MKTTYNSKSGRRPVLPWALSLAILALMLPAVLQGQSGGGKQSETVAVSGIVTDEAGAPMVGVTVIVKNTKTGKITGLDGRFKLDIPKNSVLEFSYIGYAAVERHIDGPKELTIRMSEQASVLGDVVVTALGIRRDEKALGYSTTQVSGQLLTDALATNWTEALSGKVAGLNLVRSGAGPSGSNKIILRGESNLTGDNQALIVIDGVVINNSSGLTTGTGNNSYLGEDSPVDFGSALNDINPEDIESINVLKGAGAAALYGQRGAHGAIIITTKSGEEKMKGLKVTLSSTANFETIYHWPDYQYEYGSGKEGDNYFSWGPSEDGANTRSSSVAWGPKFNGQKFYQYDPVTHAQAAERTPWIAYPDNRKDFFRMGQVYTNSVGLSGGSSSTSFRVGLTNVHNEWIIPNTGYKRNTLSLSVNQKMTDRMRLSTKLNYTNKWSDNLPATGYNNQTIMYWNIMQVPNGNLEWLKDYWMPGKEGVDQSYPFSTSPDNPYLIVNEMLNSLNRHTITGNVQINYDIHKNLSFMARGSMDMSYEDRAEQRPMDTQKFKYGMYRTTKIFSQEMQGDFLLKYDKKISAFDLSGSFGGSTLHNRYRRENNRADGLMFPQIFSLSNSKFAVVTIPYESEYVINSLYGLLTAGYKNFLFLDVTARNDWSSVLATPQSTDNVSFFYPSVNLSAVFSDIFRMPRWVTFAKLRGSYSEVGSSGTAVYQNTYVYNSVNGYSGGLANPTTLPNTNLKPQRTKTFEVGADVRLFDNRFGFDVAVYHGTTRDQILTATLDRASGYNNIVVNGGMVRNRGLEIEANTTLIRNRNGWSWKMFGTYATNENIVMELSNDLFALQLQNTLSGRGSMEARVGQSMSAIYGTGYKRSPDGQVVYDSDGYPMLADDLIWLGDSTPKGKASVGTEVKYKGWALNILVDGQYGGKGYSFTHAMLAEHGKLKNTLPGRYNGIIGDGVIENGDGTYRPNDVVADEIWTYYTRHYGRENLEGSMFSTDFIKLREVTLNYTFPSKIARKIWMKKLTVGVYGRDLFMITNWPAFDPEFGTLNNGSIDKGFEIAQFPATRNIGAKINIEF